MPARLTRWTALLLLATLTLSACASVAASPSGTPDPVGANGTHAPAPTETPTQPAPIGVDPASLRGVVIQVWHAFPEPAYDVFASQVAQFNAVNEWGITVSQSGSGDYNTLFETMETARQSGGTPDLVAALPEQILTWNGSGLVVDLNPYLRDPLLGLGNDNIEDIPSIFWAQDNVAGMQLGVPAQRSARFLYYNKTWAHELGFDAPPATIDEFRQQACAANASFRKDASVQNDGYGGWIVDTRWQTTYSWLMAFGGSVTDGQAYNFRTDQNLAALQFMKTLFDDHCAWLSSEATPFDSFARRSALFVSGDLADIWLAANAMSRLKNADEWTVLPFFGSEENSVVVYGPSYTVLRSTPEKQLAAWLFARWLLSPENQAQWVEATGLFPLRNSVLEMVGPYRTASPQWEAAYKDLLLARGVPQLASWRKIRYVLEDGTTVIFQMNTPADQIPAILADMDSMAEELNKK